MHEYGVNKVEKNVTTVSGLELKQLLIQLVNHSHICFRFRLMGEMWIKSMTQVTAINEKTVLVYDDVENKYYLIRYNSVMQFEIDHRFQNLQPHFHYNVQPSPELD
jgi:hypothetical protein